MAALNLRFVSGNNLIARAIKWWEGEDAWNHVEVVMPDGRYLGARWGTGVDYAEPGYDLAPHVVEEFLHLPLTAAELDAALAFAVSRVGWGYDWRGDAGFVARANWTMPGRLFCSRYVQQISVAAGHPLVRIAHDWKVRPATLHTSMLLQPGTL